VAYKLGFDTRFTPLAGRNTPTYHARDAMAETFILIPGRTSRQGTTLNEGKLTAAYQEETGTVQIPPPDMQRLGLVNGQRVRLRSNFGVVEVPCVAAKAGELPPGILFIPYGDASSRLMGGNTHGTGMPDSKGIDVEVSVVGNPSSGDPLVDTTAVQ
jgi:formylmethanofuran dehydrogenase subunit D